MLRTQRGVATVIGVKKRWFYHWKFVPVKSDSYVEISTIQTYNHDIMMLHNLWTEYYVDKYEAIIANDIEI